MTKTHWEEDRRAGRVKNKAVWSSARQTREQAKQDSHQADGHQQEYDEILAHHQHRTGRY